MTGDKELGRKPSHHTYLGMTLRKNWGGCLEKREGVDLGKKGMDGKKRAQKRGGSCF